MRHLQGQFHIGFWSPFLMMADSVPIAIASVFYGRHCGWLKPILVLLKSTCFTYLMFVSSWWLDPPIFFGEHSHIPMEHFQTGEKSIMLAYVNFALFHRSICIAAKGHRYFNKKKIIVFVTEHFEHPILLLVSWCWTQPSYPFGIGKQVVSELVRRLCDEHPPVRRCALRTLQEVPFSSKKGEHLDEIWTEDRSNVM